MANSVEQLIEAALLLPEDARAELADRLVESLDPSDQGRLHQLWAVEVERRLHEVRSGRIETIPGDEALARVRRALGR